MDQEQDMERFSTDTDFVDGQWIDGEFFSRGSRKKRVQTREEALYGYDSASDSDREERRRGKRRNRIITESKSSKPMNFVPGAQNVGDSQNPQQASTSASAADEQVSHQGLGFNPSEPKREEEEEEERDYKPSFGLGFKPKFDEDEEEYKPGLGLGFQPGSKPPGAKIEKGGGGFGLGYNTGSNGLGFGSSNAEENNPMLETPLGRKIHESVRQKPKSKASVEPVFGWEKSSNRFASRMLEKMGWDKSKGLGKNEAGMVRHIETVLRPKNMGLGFGDFAEVRNEAVEDAEEEKASERPKVNEKMWLKKNRNKVKEYVTAEELLKRQGEKGGGRVVEKVLDMTGPQVRVVTDMRNLNVDQEVVEDDTPMPELQHNIRLLVDLVASDVQHYDSKIRHDKQTVEILRKERERLEKQAELQSRALEVMETVMLTINGLKSERRVTLDGAVNVFKKLKTEYPEEYKAWNLSAIALSHALPLTTPRFHGWQPLVQPSRGIDVLLPWREVFEEDDEPIFADVDTSPFTRLIMDTVMPHIRRAVVNWDAKDPEPLLGFFDVWEKLLPASVMQNILVYFVLPKLNDEVDAWNPLQDTVPVHAWIHPWLPLLASKMEQMCGVIRMKLDSALERWLPDDSSAFLMLSPWHSVFDAAGWDQLLLRRIIPKLNYALDLLVINPGQQDLEPFNWVVLWSSVIPVHHMIRMLEERFFPKWLEVLFNWLSTNPNFDEVSQWYQGWKSMLPPELLANDRIRLQLQAALELMNQAVEDVPLVMKPRQQQQQQQTFEGSKVYQHLRQQKQQQQQMDADEMSSLKEMLEGFALENDVRFVPKVGRRHEGLQVYGFGSVSVSVDNHKQLILAQSGERWTSVSMADLLEMHHAKKGGKWNS